VTDAEVTDAEVTDEEVAGDVTNSWAHGAENDLPLVPFTGSRATT
jgi:hypothetical protein